MARSPIRRKMREGIADAILDATEEAAIELGLGGLTVGAVAERAGVAVGTLYNYFPDLDAIVAALFRARRAVLRPLIAAADEATRRLPFERRLLEFVRRLMIAFEPHQRFLQLAALADRDGTRAHRDTAVMGQLVTTLERIMREGARRRLFPASRAAVHARLIHGALRSIFLWRMLPARQPISAEGDLVVETFLTGVLGAYRV